MKKTAVAVSINVLQIDHLAPICQLLNVPMLVPTPEHEDLVRELYPRVRARVVDFQLYSLVPLLMQHDVVLHSHSLPRDKIRQIFERTTRVVHVPHGYGKPFAMKYDALEDIALVYGNRMLEMFKQEGVHEHLRDHVVTGNFRHAYYLEHRAFFEAKMDGLLGRLKPGTRTILYAPTWNDAQTGSTFQAACEFLVDTLPKDFSIIVKSHPNLLYNEPEVVEAMVRKYADREGVVFLKEYPLVFPLLARADVYVGDVSTVSADYLVFGRPMFFLRSSRYRSKGKTGEIFDCGTVIHEEDFSRTYEVIQRALPEDGERYAKVRREVWDDIFATRPLAAVKSELEALCEKERVDDEWEVPADLRAEFDAEDRVLKFLPGIDTENRLV